ncbi:MAG TPA: hypothetical protein VMV94_09470 [Phycisphaerae bacterium]|nr:hypothetical protein [Phycisphaerae bacterium]
MAENRKSRIDIDSRGGGGRMTIDIAGRRKGQTDEEWGAALV